MRYSVNALHKTATKFLFGKLVPVIVKRSNGRMQPMDVDKNRTFDIEIVENTFYIFVLRNPLDILVSEYYSFGWMHVENDTITIERSNIQEKTVDEYCIWMSDRLLMKLKKLPHLKENCLYLTYEEMVLDFNQWCKKFCEPFGVKNISNTVGKSEFKIKEITPEQIFAGEKNQHKRKITPNDHMCKLEQNTIDLLNEKFKSHLEFHSNLYKY